MLALTLVVASIAVADSINPSTVIPALWLASAPSAGRLASFTFGVFAVYLAGGIVLVLGPGPTLIGLLHQLHGPLEHGLQAIGGTLALALAVFLWCSRDTGRDQPGVLPTHTRGSAFVLGAGIMAIELPTAFMYFGAISAVIAAHRAASTDIVLLVTYNLVFVAPLCALLATRHLAGERVDRWIASAGDRVRGAGRIALSALAGIAGIALLTLGLTGLLGS